MDVDANKIKPRVACLSSVATSVVDVDTSMNGVVDIAATTTVVVATYVNLGKTPDATYLDAVAAEESPKAKCPAGLRVKPIDNKISGDIIRMLFSNVIYPLVKTITMSSRPHSARQRRR